jgi:tricorn protease
MKKMLIWALLQSIVIGFLYGTETRLLRFPTIHNDTIVFTYAGDLYISSINGSVASRITAHEGYEMFPRFSPDGKTIAFTAQYDGNTEVYIMPVSGGTPKRITYTACLDRDDISVRMGPNNIVMGWTPDGKNVIYRSRAKTFNDFKGHLFLAPIDAGLSKQLPFSTGSWCSYSPDAGQIAFNRVFREFRTWKYYKGGMADDIWIHDFRSQQTVNITNNPAQDIFPMWTNGQIYFLSDRDRIMNLFVYDLKTKETKRLTNFVKYDIKFPSLGTDKIIFENGGFLYFYDLVEQKVNKLSISIREDFASSRTAIKDVSSNIAGIHIAPDGSRVCAAARGEIFSIPSNQGVILNLTNSSGAHDRNPMWSPDGKYIAYISDKTGEYQIHIQATSKPEAEIQLTNYESGYLYNLKWSNDSKNLLFHNKKLELNLVNIDSRKTTNIHSSRTWEISDYCWSPDNNWIAFADRDTNRISQIYLYDIKQNKKYIVSTEWYDSFAPHFSDDGNYLFFVSNRDFNPIYSDTEWNVAYKDMSRVYFISLNKSIESPFAYVNDEVFAKDTTVKKNLPVKIDIENISQRTEVLPMSAGRYSNLNHVNRKLFFVESRTGESPSLKYFDFSDLKVKSLGNYSWYQISADKKKIMVKSSGSYYITDLPGGSSINLKEPINLSDLQVRVDLKAEWTQIFNESWRQMRDYFYDPQMHRVNWEKQKDKYAELLPYVNDRNDLNYIIGEMIGELNAGHAYVGGGDRKDVKRIKTGLLGAEFEKDKKSGYFKITKIYAGENWKESLKSPLLGIGRSINVGDYIISINRKDLANINNVYELLIGQADKIVEIEVSIKPDNKITDKYYIKTLADESELIYFNWVQQNIKLVNEATDGKVGYIHIPDMSVVGLNEFVKYYYPQLSKNALIIDDRGNGGGNVSTMLIERLRREMSMMAMSRDVPEPRIKPDGMLLGPKILLIDQYSASDGDLFPYQFRRHNLGPIIGVRTWGGVVGIRGSLPFVDGATLQKPEFAHYDESGWIIEGIGVSPDIIVNNDPYQEFIGKDFQLEKAIEVAQDELLRFEKTKSKIPDFPNKSE